MKNCDEKKQENPELKLEGKPDREELGDKTWQYGQRGKEMPPMVLAEGKEWEREEERAERRNPTSPPQPNPGREGERRKDRYK